MPLRSVNMGQVYSGDENGTSEKSLSFEDVPGESPVSDLHPAEETQHPSPLSTEESTTEPQSPPRHPQNVDLPPLSHGGGLPFGNEESFRGGLFDQGPTRQATETNENAQPEPSYPGLSPADQNLFHTSWTNTTEEDVFTFVTRGRANQSANVMVERPTSVSRIGSNQSRVSSISEADSVSSRVHDAARITNWSEVKELCEDQPEAAGFVGKDRWTALHHACNRRCPHPDVVEALIRAYPEALLLEEDKGWLPLHYACRFKAKKEVVRLLLQMYPDKGKTAVSKVDRRGRTPLYYAVRYDAPHGVVGLLLEVDASAVLEEDQDADSPLALVWDAWAEKLDGKRTLQRLYVPNAEAVDMTLENNAKCVRKRLQGQIKLSERWNKVNIFLKAAFGFSVNEDSDIPDTGSEEKKSTSGLSCSDERKWRLLHATAAIKCHPTMFLLALALHPEQALELDDNDLHAPAHVCRGCNSASNLSALHFAASSRANGESGRLVVKKLLSLNPECAKLEDSTGSLPLHRIVENKDKSNWRLDGAKDLYAANTLAINAVDNDGRLPLHRAAKAIMHQLNVSDEVMLANSVVYNVLDAHAEAACQTDNFGCLPLHHIAQNGQLWDAQVHAVYSAFPAATRARTGIKMGNKLPLHLAAGNPQAGFSLIKRLVELNPRGASQSDRQGKLPLHLACETGLPWKSVCSIHEAFPSATGQSEQNPRGWTALHMASALSGSNSETIVNLVRLCPESASIADSDGRYPLHLACLSGKSWDSGLSALFAANPDALRCSDNFGLLPLHICSFKFSFANPEESIKRKRSLETMLRRTSQSISLKTGHAIATMEAEDAKRIEILYHLLKADPTVI